MSKTILYSAHDHAHTHRPSTHRGIPPDHIESRHTDAQTHRGSINHSRRTLHITPSTHTHAHSQPESTHPTLAPDTLPASLDLSTPSSYAGEAASRCVGALASDCSPSSSVEGDRGVECGDHESSSEGEEGGPRPWPCLLRVGRLRMMSAFARAMMIESTSRRRCSL